MCLKYTIPRTKHAVYAREFTKAHMVKCLHEVRLVLRKIGDKLVEEGRLPDASLVHFFSSDELHRLATRGSSSLITRATRRSKLFSEINKRRYPPLSSGLPIPIGQNKEVKFASEKGGTVLKGTPVCEGIVTGLARVILDFNTEAQLISSNEILVTNATDTGWTPYFPLLGGVVTQIGGLLSHGAVVAREYGIPAVVGVHGATDRIRSGDTIHLDGSKGTVTIGERV